MYPIQASSMYSLSSTLLSGYSTMNNTKLQLALSGSKNYKAISSISSVNNQKLPAEKTEFLKSYQSKMTDMLGAASSYLSPSKTTTNKLNSVSSEKAVATTSGNLQKQTDSYELKVNKLASGQVNKTQGFQSSAALPSMGGALKIKSQSGTFNLNLSAAGAKTNHEALTNFASKINAAGAGVTASVVEKDGLSTLEITSEGGAFSVSGSFAERYGLDQVAQEGQEAEFTVSKNGEAAETFTSATNTVEIDGVSVTLKGTGSAKISAGTDAGETKADAMEKLVSSFNSTLKFLNQNSDQGIGVLNQMKRMVMPPTSENSMKKIGITANSDGTLSFDRAAFTKAMQDNSSLADGIANNVARGIQSDANMGMRESSSSLIGASTTGTTGSWNTASSSYDMSTINFLSAYNRSGVFNAMNMYAVGALMNISV